jgi:hypothetical protein
MSENEKIFANNSDTSSKGIKLPSFGSLLESFSTNDYAQLIEAFANAHLSEESNLYSEKYLQKLRERELNLQSCFYLIVARQKYLNTVVLQNKAFGYFKRNLARFKKYLISKSPLSFVKSGDRSKITFMISSLFYPILNLKFQN